MVSPDLWLGESLVLGIVVFWIGTLFIFLSMPLAYGKVRAHEYNYRPMRIYKLSDEEMDRLGKPTARATIAFASLYVLTGLIFVALGLTGNAGPIVLDLFLGLIGFTIFALVIALIVTGYLVSRDRKKRGKASGVV